VDAADVVAELSRVFGVRDWRAMRALYHPSALILTVTGGPAPLAPDDVIAELERSTEDFIYSVSASEPIALDEHATIVTGHMRRRMPKGGWEDAGHTWLITVREGLVYRQGVYHDLAQAREAYARLGVTLGLSDPG
jgi:hypothetical protein